MMFRYLRRPHSIFGHTLLLVMGVVIAVSLGSIAVIMFRPPPPYSPPVSAYEIARLLDGKPIASSAEFERLTAASPPTMQHGQRDPLIEQAVAYYLGVDPAQVRFRPTTGIEQLGRQHGPQAQSVCASRPAFG